MNRYVGQRWEKVDAISKVTGRAEYPADIYFPEMLYARVKRASHPHAILQSLDVSRAEQVPGVVKVIKAEDVPEVKKFGLIVKDQPVLVARGEKMRFLGDALALVIAEDRDAADRALELIDVQFAPLEVVTDPMRAMEAAAPAIHHGGNILASHQLEKGDVEKGLAEADLVVEREYRTQHLDQVPLQVEAGVGLYEDDTIKLYVATQWLHDTRADVANSLGLPQDKVRIVQPAIGGAFGRREDISVHIHLALAAMATGRPVKMVYTREESMIAQSKRHPLLIRARTGATRHGYLTAWQVEVIGDTGAYASSGPAVVHKSMYHCTGPYNVDNVQGVSYTVYTNNTYCGAMRGFGATQMAFAYESQMDILAHKLGIDPARFRLQNAYKIGSKTPNGQALNYSVNVRETIREAWKMTGLQLQQNSPPGSFFTGDGEGLERGDTGNEETW
ncbi:MAG: molybdopterin cofactor-binding domain-containing protein [Halanaerobium sp.]|nr:molybdopterin cofactor-binding domain-containing protein [Halanaerobium sp.]